tara:strand:+ start:7449 stop:8828 length:1380 start_codon:yes stop_codon:yes gene_type:complete
MEDDSKLLKIFEAYKREGISPEHEKLIREELSFRGTHEVLRQGTSLFLGKEYAISNMSSPDSGLVAPNYQKLNTLDDLLERDKQRESDGFPKKIRIGRIIRPGKGGNRMVIVPTTTEDKFYHDTREDSEDQEEGEDGEESTGGSGKGEEGEIIGESPIHDQDGPGPGGAGSGEGENHEVGSSAFDLGKILTEKFKLPNIKPKGKKRSLKKFIYDLTDKNRGSGQVLDKKETLKQILKTNISLERIDPDKEIDPADLLVNPRDYIYHTLSKEMDYESQALVFFLRDYSGSMYGRPTDIVCSQHVMIYSWLVYQYKDMVESRFILHDTDAKEVEDFYTYYNSAVAGGTRIASSFKLVNKIVDEDNLAKDYNIYVFYGGDGGDWDNEGKETIDEIRHMFSYTNRLGITVVSNMMDTAFGKYLNNSEILKKKDLVRLDRITEQADEDRIIEGIRRLVSENGTN